MGAGEIKIKNNLFDQPTVFSDGKYFRNFIENSGLKNNEKQNLINSTLEILSNCIPASFNNISEVNNTGLVIGKIQSGKTMSFTSLINLANDNNFKVIFVISGRTNLLLNQTRDRLKKDLLNDNDNNFKFLKFDFGEEKKKSESKNNRNSVKFRKKRELIKDIKDVLKRGKKTLIIPILKHQDHIRNFASIFFDNNVNIYLQKRGVLIIDDEADQASLNTYERSNSRKGTSDESAIYNSLKQLKDSLPNHSFIQYTATPLANLLIDQYNVLSPKWHVILSPGDDYTGGKAFFKNKLEFVRPIKIEYDDVFQYPPDTSHLNSPPKSLINSIKEFLILSSFKSFYDELKYNGIKKPKDFKKATMLIHPSWIVNEKDGKKGINTFSKWTNNIVDDLISDIDNDDYSRFESTYNKIKKEIEDKNYYNKIPSFSEINMILSDEIPGDIKVHTVIGGMLDSNDGFPWGEHKFNILVGGQLLDRGFTVENLIMTYMPRDSRGKNQADTIEQRCRFYGYRKNYLDFCRVYITEGLLKDYIDYNESEEYILNYLKENTLSEFVKNGSKFLMSKNLNPTNTQRLKDNLKSSKFEGWIQFDPQIEFLKNNNKLIEKFLNKISKYQSTDIEPYKLEDVTNDRTHRLFKLYLGEIIDLLIDFELDSNYRNKQFKSSLIQLLSIIEEENENVQLLNIAYKNEFRERRIVKKDNQYKISQLYTGDIRKKEYLYYGDRYLIWNKEKSLTNPKIVYNNEVIVQIHKIKAIIDNNDSLNGSIFNTIAIYIPKTHSKRFLYK